MFDQLMAAHLKGVFFLTQSLLLVIADGGRIVNLSSELIPGYAAYAMMKGGIEVLTCYLAKELGPGDRGQHLRAGRHRDQFRRRRRATMPGSTR